MLKKIFVCSALTVSVLAIAGCKTDSNLVDHVNFSASLTKVSVSIVFKNTVTSNMSGIFTVKDYGDIFVDPTTATTPLELGFDLNPAVVNDQDYVNATPTQALPNGEPTGLDYPVVQIHAPTTVGTNYDLYGYVDVLKHAWLGAAVIFNFFDQKNFPNGLTYSQVYLRDNQGVPIIVFSIFGPTTNPDGSMKQPGGISIFANAASLAAQSTTGKVVKLHAEPGYYLSGPAANEYEGQDEKLNKLELNVLKGISQLY